MKQARTRAVAAASVFSFLPLITPVAAADTVDVNLAALPPGKTVVVRFSATVVTPFPIGDAGRVHPGNGEREQLQPCPDRRS